MMAPRPSYFRFLTSVVRRWERAGRNEQRGVSPCAALSSHFYGSSQKQPSTLAPMDSQQNGQSPAYVVTFLFCTETFGIPQSPNNGTCTY